MTSRERILDAVRSGLGRKQGTAVPPPPPVPTVGRTLTQAERIASFRTRLQAVGGVVHEVADAAAAAAVVRDVLAQHGARSLACSRSPLVQAVTEPLRVQAPALRLHVDADRDELATVDAGLTAASHGIAETGTLVLADDLERARLPSLLPPLHVALLPVSALFSHLGEALAGLPRPLPRAVTFVTGPSRTADIELELVVGVHGPKALHVILIAELWNAPALPAKDLGTP